MAYYGWLFDEGAAASIADVDSSTIRITPVKNWNNQWAWYCMKYNQLLGKTPTYLIAKANHFSMVSGMWLACYATTADTDTWTQFDNVTIGASDLSFSNNTAFGSGDIYISHWPMYPFSRVKRLVSEWRANALVSDPASATNGIIGYTASRNAGDGSGRTAPALPYYGLKLTTTAANTKNKAILTAFNHPSETQGPFQLEGAITWLLAQSPEAKFLCDWFEFYIYPCLNPQGVWSGYFRSNPESPTSDHNRIWDADTREDAHTFRDAFAADTGGTIEVGIDFHGSSDAGDGYMSSDDHTAGLYAVWLAKMQAYDAGFAYSDAALTQSLRTLWTGTYSASLAFTCEYGAINSKGITDWKNQGQYALRSLTTMLAEGRFTNGPEVGSRDFNGTTDRIDWASVANLTSSPITISMWVYLDRVNTDQYLMHLAAADDGVGIQFGNFGTSVGSGNFCFARKGSTTLVRRSVNSTLATGVWTHILATHDGTFTDYTTIHCYKDGTEMTYVNGVNGVTETTVTGKWSLGGRVLDDLRNTDGKIAHVGVWNRVLTATEIVNLAAGYSPDLAASTGLQFYFAGNTSSLVATPPTGGSTGTADGTTQVTGVGNGPAIIYP